MPIFKSETNPKDEHQHKVIIITFTEKKKKKKLCYTWGQGELSAQE